MCIRDSRSLDVLAWVSRHTIAPSAEPRLPARAETLPPPGVASIDATRASKSLIDKPVSVSSTNDPPSIDTLYNYRATSARLLYDYCTTTPSLITVATGLIPQ